MEHKLSKKFWIANKFAHNLSCLSEHTSHLHLSLRAQQTQVVVVVVPWESWVWVYLQCVVAFALRRIRDTDSIDNNDPIRLQHHIISNKQHKHSNEKSQNAFL